jgi:hypothetical protein|tara:strand:+ start:393 stop:515 length:123 start_codon:yes stop_codon:yes gene_type:complete
MKYIHPITKKEISKKEMFEFMFGKRFMKSKNKGEKVTYKI